MCADPDTPERLGVDVGIRRSMPSGWSDSDHALVSALLQDPTDCFERLSLFSWDEQELVYFLPRFLQRFQDRLF